ncbi:MAG: hypothetical protein AAFX05_06100 [Planctomycetota bacterium]
MAFAAPLKALRTLFSSVRFGVTLLTILFVYATIGSSGIPYPTTLNPFGPWGFSQVRTLPAFELTEFEWFHTWFFLVLCALIAANIIVATLTRIRLSVVNLGVWMIHTGIITLIVGSVIYFGTKVEGDAPVFRRAVVINVEGAGAALLPALPGRSAAVETNAGPYLCTVVETAPELPSGEPGYAVSVAVQTPTGGRFVRRLVDGQPQLTADALPGGGPVPVGIVDPGFTLALQPLVQEDFWIKESRALAFRSAETAESWNHVSLDGLPRFNDYYAQPEDVWPLTSSELDGVVRPIDMPVAVPEQLADLDIRITGFLRYAVEQSRRVPGGHRIDPVALVELSGPQGAPSRHRLAALRPQERTAGGALEFRYVESMDALEAMQLQADPSLTLSVEGSDPVTLSLAEPGTALTDVGAGWQARVHEFIPQLTLPNGALSLVVLHLRTPEGTDITRWVFEDASINRDISGSPDGPGHGAINARGESRELDTRLTSTFRAGFAFPLMLVGGPDDVGLRLLSPGPDGINSAPIQVGQGVTFTGGAGLRVIEFSLTAREEIRPFIVPPRQRDRNSDIGGSFSMIRVELASGGWSATHWLPFHRYSFDDPRLAVPGLGRAEPTLLALPDGRRVEMIFTRERRPLPAPVILDDFILTSHVGGFTGDVSSIRDWTSVLRFESGDGWTMPKSISTNAPVAFAGLSYFQSFWDAPRPPSQMDFGTPGMNFTGLGVGNRNGVVTQLAGGTLAVIGMLYAFYVKPVIKRRRRERVLADIEAKKAIGMQAETRQEVLA